MRTLDVCVLGGGPAGCACALGLARAGLDVAVLERTRYDGWRIGEILTPEAGQILQQLGLWEAFVADGHLPAPGVVSLWGTLRPHERDALFSPYGLGWHLDRAKFDATLARAVEGRGVGVHREARVRTCQRGSRGRWTVEVRSPEGELRLDSAFVVDATGRAAWLARRQGARRVAYDRLVGIVGVREGAAYPDHRLYLEAFESGWWYATALPGGHGVAACMTDADALPRAPARISAFWRDSLRHAPRTAELIGPEGAATVVRTVTAGTSRLESVCGPGWVAVGDAAASYDPLSSRGIGMALATGVAAAAVVARALREGQPGALAAYSDWLRADYSRYLDEWRRYYAGAATRWPASSFWTSRGGGG
jgi:flavin-dependent dehydrogenase